MPLMTLRAICLSLGSSVGQNKSSMLCYHYKNNNAALLVDWILGFSSFQYRGLPLCHRIEY